MGLNFNHLQFVIVVTLIFANLDVALTCMSFFDSSRQIHKELHHDHEIRITNGFGFDQHCIRR